MNKVEIRATPDDAGNIPGPNYSNGLLVSDPKRVTAFRLAPWSRQELVTRRQVAKMLNVSLHCVQRWAERGTGPRFYKKGPKKQQRTGYRIEDVEEFQRQRERHARRCGHAQLAASEILS